MRPTRRQFIAIAAAFAASPGRAAVPNRWSARAFGAEIEVLLHAPRDIANARFDEISREIRRIERLFSLYDPESTLSRLNAAGSLEVPKTFLALVAEADRAFHLTGGLFDPTIQPLWRALAMGHEVQDAQASLGWQKVSMRAARLQLGPGQALSFNGIAQGFATDLITEKLRQSGARKALVNIGEHRALGGPFRLGLDDGHMSLEEGAIATSVPGALQIGTRSHILGPQGQAPVWSQVSVEAETATRADALSTALCFADLARIKEIKRNSPDLRRIWVSDKTGRIWRIDRV